MINSFSMNVPLLMGSGSSELIGEQVKNFGCNKILLIFDKNLKELGLLDKVIESLDHMNIARVYFDEVLPDAPDTTILKAAKIAESEKVDGIIGVGGGSAIDTAKAVSMLATNSLPLAQFFDPSSIFVPGLPAFYIPTTSGTGSEVTSVSVITDTSISNIKKVMNVSPAKLAILDPLMTLGLPPQITATTGLDAFSHAAEALTSIISNPISDILAIEAMRKIVKYLPKACKEGKNIEARENLMLASSIAGMAFNNAGVHLGHSIAHVLGGKFHIHHGAACAIALPHVLEYISISVPEKVKIIGECLGVAFTGNESSEQIGVLTSGTLQKFIEEVKCPSMKDFKLDLDAVKKLAELVTEEPVFALKPKEMSVTDVEALLVKAYQA